MKYRPNSIPFIQYFWVGMFLCLFFTSCKTHQPEATVEASDVLVQLYENSLPEAVEKEFEAYELSMLKRVSRPMNIYLFSYNSKKIQEESLLALLKQSKLVKEAQSNKDVQTRN